MNPDSVTHLSIKRDWLKATTGWVNKNAPLCIVYFTFILDAILLLHFDRIYTVSQKTVPTYLLLCVGQI